MSAGRGGCGQGLVISRPVNKPFKPSPELCLELNCLAPDSPDLN